eukprot:SM000042S15293  [mRNA]  locus=s42:91649:94133:- [translate_table: standard]
MAARVVPLVALGAWTFKHITAAVGPFMGPIAAECGRRHKGSALAPARTFLCTIVPFFQEGLQGHAGPAILLPHPGAAACCCLLPAPGLVSSSAAARLTDRRSMPPRAGFLVWGTFVSAGQSFLTFAAELRELTCSQRRLHASQVFGVSVILPLLWLPAYFLSGAADQRKAAPTSRAVSVQRIVAIAIVMYVQTIFCVCLMLPFETDLLKKLIAIFQIIPVVAPFFWLPAAVTERSTKNKDQGHSAVLALHLVQAGAALAWHVVAVPYAGLLHPSALSEVYNLFHSHEGGSACKYFLLVDLLVFIGANFYQVLLEHGILALLVVAAGTVLVGPGAALALYYAYREAQFLALPADDAKKSD